MTERDHNYIAKNPSADDLDRALDVALAKYASAEPRQGLEDRILENLRAEQAKAPNRAWWRWTLTAGAVALVLYVVTLAGKSTRLAKPVIADHATTASQQFPQPQKQVAGVAKTVSTLRVRAPRHKNVERSVPAVAAANPKLDQFPSPQPLSEQEKILESYVRRYPKDAALIAEARMEVLRRDREQQQRELSGDNSADSAQK